MTTKCLIVDDEPLAIEVIKLHIKKIDSFEIAGTCKDAFEAFNFLSKNKIDLIFLDIHMPEMKGTELIKTLQYPPKVVLTTAHRQYALEGYDLNVLDYLLKPISFERFLQTVNKYNSLGALNEEVSVRSDEGDNNKFIYLREKNIIHKIPLSEVVYIESMRDYLKIHTDKRMVSSRCTISSVEGVLPTNDFLRIHRSFIISLKRISSFSPVGIHIGEKEFPVGPSYKKEVYKKLDYNRFVG